MEEYYRQVCVCRDGDDGPSLMVTIHMILGTGTKQSSFRSKITIAAMVLEVFFLYIWVIDNWLEKKFEKVQ